MRKRARSSRSLSSAVMLFFFSAFLLLALRDYDREGFILAVCVPAMIWLGTHLLPRLFPADGLLLSLTNFLCALGVLVLYDTNPALAVNQALYYGIGLAAMVFCIYLIRIIRSWRLPVLLLMPMSVAALLLPLLFGRETNGATNWIHFGSWSLQPSELVKISLIVILSYWMSRHRAFPWLVFALTCLALLMLQKDLGTALMYFSVALILYYASSGNLILTAAGLAGGAGAALYGYHTFAHVRKRVAVWRNPWSDYDGAGYQIVQGLIALASGGLFGCGLGLGSPKTIPVYHTDYIFAVICEQFGLIFGLCVLAVYISIIWRGAATAMAARTGFHGLVAMGCTTLIALQTFTIVGGVLKLVPLTGVTMPFVSYGGTSLLSSMCLAGLIQGVASLNEDDYDQDTDLAMASRKGGAL